VIFITNVFVFFVVYCILYNKQIKKSILQIKKFEIYQINYKIIISTCIAVYLSIFILIYISMGNIFASIFISFLPALIPYIIFDIIIQALREEEKKQITQLVMILAKWSIVRNDLIFCIRKVCESEIKNPTKRLINRTYIRINSGMNPIKALQIMEKEAFSDNFIYLIKNIGFSAKKGGNLSLFFRNAEKQYFQIDEELYKRKISSYRDRVSIYIVMVGVLLIAFAFISKEPRIFEFYLKTQLGQNLTGIFCFMYCIGILLTIK